MEGKKGTEAKRQLLWEWTEDCLFDFVVKF
jgi:hypothetical protein